METFKIGICESEDFSIQAIDILKEIGDVSFFSGEDLSAFVEDKNVIFVRLKYYIDEQLIVRAKNLQYICSPTTGLNHINILDDKIKIVSLKGESEFLNTIRATPEHVFGLSLSLFRNYSHAFMNSKNKTFDRNIYKGYELYNNSIGIIGLGRVGSIISQYFSAFGAKVYYYDTEKRESKVAFLCKTLDEVIDKSQLIILCVNYTPENEKMINESHFKRMQGKYFINAARGELVNEDELIKYIKKDWFKGVAIDVFSDETKKSRFLEEVLPLCDKSNIIITPHIGGATYSSMERTEVFIANKLLKLMGK